MWTVSVVVEKVKELFFWLLPGHSGCKIREIEDKSKSALKVRVRCGGCCFKIMTTVHHSTTHTNTQKHTHT